MDAIAWHRRRDLTMWSVHGHQFGQRRPPRTVWWNDNRGRQPAGVVVAQYIRCGRAVLREAGVDRPVAAGDLVLFAFGEDTLYGRPPDLPGWSGHDELLITDHVSFQGAGLAEHWSLLRARHGSIIPLPPRSPFLAALAATVEPGPQPACERVALLVSALAGVVEDAAGLGRSPVAQAIDAILAAPCSDHNLKAVAERCGCSREHLGRMFQEQIGSPPAAWMRQRRIERALALLRDTNLPIGVVAERCGAGSVHRLARWTRLAQGLPPLAVRRRLRAEAAMADG